ncbi:uncharacterized protein LOC131217358 [Magnolia sinica]|uniref:uncharacterized protein LOC131217358 n=1 Tax=Magnolia sinica TaxID=86752 RepID=UPI002657E5BA|nr:uncharacterized protein LOC131217358 [Magnolia sinica]
MALGEPGAEKCKVNIGDVMDLLYQTDIWEQVELPMSRRVVGSNVISSWKDGCGVCTSARESEEQIYMKKPERFEVKGAEKRLCKRSWFDLSPRQWFDYFMDEGSGAAKMVLGVETERGVGFGNHRRNTLCVGIDQGCDGPGKAGERSLRVSPQVFLRTCPKTDEEKQDIS